VLALLGPALLGIDSKPREEKHGGKQPARHGLAPLTRASRSPRRPGGGQDGSEAEGLKPDIASLSNVSAVTADQVAKPTPHIEADAAAGRRDVLISRSQAQEVDIEPLAVPVEGVDVM
jgi:hypothetical protein